MINKIWCFFILISIIFSLINGNLESINQSLFSSINDTTRNGDKFIWKYVFLVWNNENNFGNKLAKKIKENNSTIE